MSVNFERRRHTHTVPCLRCTCLLSSVDLTPPEERQELATISTVIHCRKGETIFQQGSPVDGIYIVCEGRMKLARRMPKGRSLLIKFLDEGDIFVEAVLVGQRVHNTYLKALEASQVLCLIGRERAQRWLLRHPHIANALLKNTTQDLFDLWRRLSATSYGNPLNHLAALLVELGHRYGQPQSDHTLVIDREVSKTELAQLAGLSRRSVSTYFAQLERRGLIRCEQTGHITLLDPTRLSAVAEDDEMA